MAETAKKKSKDTGKKDSGKASAGGDRKQVQIKEMQEKRQRDSRVIDEIWGVVILAIGVFLIITTQLNTTGAFGDAIHDILKGLFGAMAYVLPYYFVILAFCLFFKKMQHINFRTAFFSILIYLMLCILNSMRFIDSEDPRYQLYDILRYYRKGVEGEFGGAIGMELGSLLVKLIGKPGVIILTIAIIVISLLLVVNTPISNYFVKLKERHEEKRLIREMEEEEAEKVAAMVANNTAGKTELPPDPTDDQRILTELESHRSQRKIEPEPEKKSRIQIINPLKKKEPDLFQPEEDGTRLLKESSDRSAGTGTAPLFPEDDSAKKEQFVQFLKDNDLSDLGTDKPAETRSSEPKISEPKYVEPEPQASHFGLDGVRTIPSGYGLDGYADPEAEIRARKEQEAYLKERKAARRKEQEGKPAVEKEILIPEERTATSHLDEAADLAAAAAALNIKEVKKANTPTGEDHAEVLKEVAESMNKVEKKPYHLPPVDLLRKPKGSQMMMSDHQLEEKAELLERTLKNFHVDARVLTVTQGSSVTRYEVQPAIGVKVSSITKLADDIALNLRAKSIRI